ncbi:MAG: ATP-binding cassette domain-containing protein [Candidatus Omnitrophica bacterium]|nr:ATP-binding cassette domain-containing protein [Candidatus Omnitrophota bacterium]
MIRLNNISKSYGVRTLFDGINLTINRGLKCGLVGPNGAGKSTLFSLILGSQEPTSGQVQIKKQVSIGYLPQEMSFESNDSVLSEATKGDHSMRRMVKEKKKLEDAGKAGSKKYGDILHKLEFKGYFQLEHKAEKILTGLGFTEKMLAQPVNELSGGWGMRIYLARLLTSHYDILLLDEPMNHLDLAAALWFKDYLLKFNGTFIMISHDKDFLEQVTDHILVLENETITKVKGNYQNYEKIQSQKASHLLKQAAEQAKKRKQLQDFIARFHGQPTKAAQVRAKRKMIEKMEKIDLPFRRRESVRNFQFPGTKNSGYQVIRLEDASKSYGDLKVYQNLDFEIVRQEKAVLAGINGAGKSTLLKILAGEIDLDSGRRRVGSNVGIGYFSQRRMEMLSASNTVFDEVYSAAEGNCSEQRIRTILSLFLFTGDDVSKKVEILSGGEKSRLILAKLLINPPNFLLLDEPTIHLDIDATEALIRALKVYQGTLVFISHDIHFVRSVANVVYEVRNGKIRKFPGNFDYYWQRAKEKGFVEDANYKQPKPAKKVKSARDIAKEEKKLERQKIKQQQKQNAALSKKIKALRKEKEKIEIDRNVKARILSNPRSYHNKKMVIDYGAKLKVIEQRLKAIDAEIAKLEGSFL